MIFYPPVPRLASVLPKEAQPYIAAFIQAGQAEGWPAELIAAICWRESWFGLMLQPKGPEGVGDDGHGRGLMQIDDRSWQTWLELKNALQVPLWQVPEANIRMGAYILSECRKLLPMAPLAAQVAAYNAGSLRVANALASNKPVDSVTTNRNYSGWVLGKAETSHALALNGDGCDCCLCGVNAC